MNQKVVLRILDKLGFGADVANDGQEACDMAAITPKYDLVLMDLQVRTRCSLTHSLTQHHRIDELTTIDYNIPTGTDVMFA